MSALDILENLQGITSDSLPRLQRQLIITDGTLTETLEATFLERIKLIKLSEHIISSTAAYSNLELDKEEKLLERRILLQGDISKTNYVYAESVIAVHQLPPALQDELVNSDISLGRLWLKHRLETFKEFLDVKYVPAGERSHHFGYTQNDMLFARTYRVFLRTLPVMLISEYFPAAY